VDEVTEAGFSPEQARANVKFVRHALEGCVATGSDIAERKGEIEKLSLRMTILVLGTGEPLGAFIKFFPG
jgi:hypothetical protein